MGYTILLTDIDNTLLDFTAGSRAAIRGGTTTIVDFVPQAPGDSLMTAVEKHAGRAEGKAWVDYALEQKAVILFDAAYEAFITQPGLALHDGVRVTVSLPEELRVDPTPAFLQDADASFIGLKNVFFKFDPDAYAKSNGRP